MVWCALSRRGSGGAKSGLVFDVAAALWVLAGCEDVYFFLSLRLGRDGSVVGKALD